MTERWKRINIGAGTSRYPGPDKEQNTEHLGRMIPLAFTAVFAPFSLVLALPTGAVVVPKTENQKVEPRVLFRGRGVQKLGNLVLLTYATPPGSRS